MTAREQERENAHALAMLIGIRPAARKLGLNESTVKSWASRYQWQIPEVFKLNTNRKPAVRPNAAGIAQAMADSMSDIGAETKLYLASLALRAAYAGNKLEDQALLNRDTAIALHNHARTADIVHGYTQHAPAVAVQINVEKSNEIRARFAADVEHLRKQI